MIYTDLLKIKKKKEQKRLLAITKFETDARALGYKYVAGVDEAGRGPLAGPVVAAACIIPEGFYIPDINDSKQLTAEQRQDFFNLITADSRIHYGIGIVEHNDIDRLNIHYASLHAMLLAISKLSIVPDYLLIDGKHAPATEISHLKIVKGDSLSQSIAAASILAKVTRDTIMIELAKKWPQYSFESHKGYATQDHLAAIEKHGPCEIHRLSFDPFKTQARPEQLYFEFT